MPSVHDRTPIYDVGERLAGGVIGGYGGCYNAKIAITLQALPFYRIRVEEISFSSIGASLYCPTVREANRAATLLQQFSEVVQSSRSGGYANSDRGWVEVHFQESCSPWYCEDAWMYKLCHHSEFYTITSRTLNGMVLRMYRLPKWMSEHGAIECAKRAQRGDVEALRFAIVCKPKLRDRL